MPRYTVIMDFKGGTYISQVQSENQKNALEKWALELDTSEIFGLGDAGKARLLKGARSEEPIALEGLSQVWCAYCLIPGPALINIVQTYE